MPSWPTRNQSVNSLMRRVGFEPTMFTTWVTVLQTACFNHLHTDAYGGRPRRPPFSYVSTIPGAHPACTVPHIPAASKCILHMRLCYVDELELIFLKYIPVQCLRLCDHFSVRLIRKPQGYALIRQRCFTTLETNFSSFIRISSGIWHVLTSPVMALSVPHIPTCLSKNTCLLSTFPQTGHPSSGSRIPAL